MMYLGHLSSVSFKRNPFFQVGLLIPDVSFIAARVPYEATHALAETFHRDTIVHAQLYGEHVVAFAAGMVQHILADRVFPQLANLTQDITFPTATEVQRSICLRAVKNNRENVTLALQLPALAALVELSVAQAGILDASYLNHIPAVVESSEIVRFSASAWSLSVPVVKHAYTRWLDHMRSLPLCNPRDFAETELTEFWPRFVVGHLYNVGIITRREAILARKQIERKWDTVLQVLFRESRIHQTVLCSLVAMVDPKPQEVWAI